MSNRLWRRYTDVYLSPPRHGSYDATGTHGGLDGGSQDGVGGVSETTSSCSPTTRPRPANGANGTAFSDFVYYSSTGILGGAINNCLPGASADILELTSAAAFQDPGTGAEVVYTEPTTPIATAAAAPFGNAVYATGGTSVFAPTQTLTTWETPAMATGIVTPGIYGTGTIAVTYNEAPICPNTLAGIQAAFVYSNGGKPAYPTCAVLVLTC